MISIKDFIGEHYSAFEFSGIGVTLTCAILTLIFFNVMWGLIVGFCGIVVSMFGFGYLGEQQFEAKYPPCKHLSKLEFELIDKTTREMYVWSICKDCRIMVSLKKEVTE